MGGMLTLAARKVGTLEEKAPNKYMHPLGKRGIPKEESN